MKSFGKRFAAPVLALAILGGGCLAGLTACGGPSDGGEEFDPDKTNITVWVQYSQQGFFERAEDLFEAQNSDINIRIIGQPESNLGASLDTTMGIYRENESPDIVATYGGLVASTLVKSGHLLNINDIISPIEEHLVGAAKSNKKDGNGEYYTAPLDGFASPVIYYNQTMFEEMKASNKLSAAQKATVKEPETYAELKALCDTVTAYGKQTITGGFSTWHLPHFMQAIHTRTMSVEAYEKMLDRNADPNPFDNDAYQDGWKLLKKYSDDGILRENIQGITVDTANTEFYQNDAAMRMGVSLDYAALNENVTFDIGAFFLPLEDNGLEVPRATGVYADVIAVSKRSPYHDACKKFISFIMQSDTQALLADYSLFPARNDADITGKLSPTLEGLYNEMAKGMNDFYQSWSFPGIDIQLLEAGSAVLGGKRTNGSNGTIEEITLDARKKVAAFFDLGKNSQ